MEITIKKCEEIVIKKVNNTWEGFEDQNIQRKKCDSILQKKK
jgi:hypothetical protein